MSLTPQCHQQPGSEDVKRSEPLFCCHILLRWLRCHEGGFSPVMRMIWGCLPRASLAKPCDGDTTLCLNMSSHQVRLAAGATPAYMKGAVVVRLEQGQACPITFFGSNISLAPYGPCNYDLFPATPHTL
jgi:hypothetical protein